MRGPLTLCRCGGQCQIPPRREWRKRSFSARMVVTSTISVMGEVSCFIGKGNGEDRWAGATQPRVVLAQCCLAGGSRASSVRRRTKVG